MNQIGSEWSHIASFGIIGVETLALLYERVVLLRRKKLQPRNSTSLEII